MASMLIFLVLLGGVFYFLLIRPQRRAQSAHRELIESLQEGDKVITMSGIYGEIEAMH